MLFPRIREFRFTAPNFNHPLGSGGRKPKGFDQTKQETSESSENGDSLCNDYADLPALEENPNSSMGLSLPVICHSEAVPPAKATRIRKGKPITSYTRKMLKASSALLQDEIGRQRLSFLTLTLPGLPSEQLARCNENFHELTRQFCQTLRRKLQAAGVSQEYVCSIEVQEGRWKTKGEIALHAHLVFQGRKHRNKTDWVFPVKEITEVWTRLISNLLGYRLNGWNNGVDVKVVKKDAANYLGKYLSKGGKITHEIIDAGRREELPSKWDRISDSLRRKVKAGIRQFTKAAKEQIAYNLAALKEQGILEWYHEIKLDFSTYPVRLCSEEEEYKEGIQVVSICGKLAEGWEDAFEFETISN